MAAVITRADPTLDRVPHPVSEAGHPHGKTSSWMLVGAVLLAFAVGGLAIIFHLWWLLIACGVVVVLAIPAGAMIHIMSDTVGWTGVAPSSVYPGHIVREACKIYDKEHEAAR